MRAVARLSSSVLFASAHGSAAAGRLDGKALRLSGGGSGTPERLGIGGRGLRFVLITRPDCLSLYVNLIQRVQRNQQRIRILRIAVQKRDDGRVGLLVQAEMRLRDGEIAPDVVVLRLPIERLAQWLERFCGLAETKQSVGENHLQGR
jgi:hypothetical protein